MVRLGWDWLGYQPLGNLKGLGYLRIDWMKLHKPNLTNIFITFTLIVKAADALGYGLRLRL